MNVNNDVAFGLRIIMYFNFYANVVLSSLLQHIVPKTFILFKYSNCSISIT